MIHGGYLCGTGLGTLLVDSLRNRSESMFILCLSFLTPECQGSTAPSLTLNKCFSKHQCVSSIDDHNFPSIIST